MYNVFFILAEIGSSAEIAWDYTPPAGGAFVAGIFLLLILCVGVVVDVGLVLYLLKRPPRVRSWHEALRERALPGRLVLFVFLILFTLYVVGSMAYGALFPEFDDVLLFQALFVHVPALMILAGLFVYRSVSERKTHGLSWRGAPKMLGLSVLLYLAAIPFLWFYSVLYQFLLHRFGINVHLQEVAEMLIAPASMLKRAALYFTAIVLVPIYEEVVFRGVFLPWAVRRTGFWPGIAIVSIIFAAIHIHLPSFLPLFLLSAMFCVAYARTRSLWVPIGMHACFNGVSVILLTLTGG